MTKTKLVSEHYYAVLEDLERQRANLDIAIDIVARIAHAYGEAEVRAHAPKPQETPDGV